MPTDNPFLSVAQAAEELRLTTRAVRHRIKAGTLEATKLGPGTASYVITREEVERIKAEDSCPA
jgi:excisionase family DNA binding protein